MNDFEKDVELRFKIAREVLPALLEIRWREFWQYHTAESKDFDPCDVWHQFEDAIGTCPGGLHDCNPIETNPAVEAAWGLADQMVAEYTRRLEGAEAAP